jgi:1A family penicillin-binding protein
MARRKQSASKKKKNSPKKTYIIDLRKFKKKLRKIGLSKVWVGRIISPIKAYRTAKKDFADFQKNTKKKLSLGLNSLKTNFIGIFVKKRKRGRPPKKKQRTFFKKITLFLIFSIIFNMRIRFLEYFKKLFSNKSKKKVKKTKKIKKVKNKDRTFRVKSKSGVIYYSNPFINIANYYRRHPLQVFFSIIFSVVLFSGTYFFYDRVLKDLPSPLDLVEKEQIVTTRILDRNGKILFRIYKDENRTLVPIAAIPEHVKQATIAIEDKDFYQHRGFSVSGITRATLANIQGKPVQGGSTITQQLIKNRLLSPERTIERKIRELIVAVLVEGTFSKDEILEMYFNEIAYGGAIYGIEEASQKYYGKSVSRLTLAEGAMLAGLPQAPSEYTPFGSNPELSYARQAEVLRRMVEDGYISEEEAMSALQEELQFKSDTIDIKAPHFVMYVKELLAAKYGEDVVSQGGLEVKTTLDLSLQEQAQQALIDELKGLERLNVQNGATLVTNPQTGEILSMVGSKNYFDFENDGQVNVTLRPRQPGSSIKPITYALALEAGKNPITRVQDTPITYQIVGSPPYSPKNYDGKFHGNVPLKEALASSYNIPAVKLLAELGVNRMIDKAELMGISTWQDRKRFGLSLTLGGGEVLMTDMAKVYGTFANGGKTVELNPLLEVKDVSGKVIYENKCALEHNECFSTQTVDPRVAYLITDILSDNQARMPAFGLYSVLNIPDQQVAVKTGTTNSLRDNWTFGYTSDRVVSVWVGNNNNTSMSNIASGITGASPIWNQIMRLNLDEENPHKFASPSGLIRLDVCSAAGTLPCNGCLTSSEYFIHGTEPKFHCNGEILPQYQLKNL